MVPVKIFPCHLLVSLRHLGFSDTEGGEYIEDEWGHIGFSANPVSVGVRIGVGVCVISLEPVDRMIYDISWTQA